MELSLSPSSSVSLSAICLRQSISSCRTKIKIKVTGKSSALLGKSSQILASTELDRHKSCSKLFTPGEYTRGNAIRVLDSTQAEADGTDLKNERTKNFLHVFWRFLRPFVLRGTIVGFTAILARTWIEHSHPLKWSQLLKASAGLVALLCVDASIAGINQIFDVEIDKINKPDLPIAAGDLSLESAWLLVTSFVAIGISIGGALNSAPFACSVYGLFFIGTVYSVPPIRMKRSTVGAILAIAVLEGVWVLGAFSATRASLGLPFVLRRPSHVDGANLIQLGQQLMSLLINSCSFQMTLISIFMTLYSAATAILKDLSDIEGDRKFEVPTLATIIGVRSMAFIGSGLILMNYIGAILAAIYMPQIFRRNIMITAHTILALFLIYQTWKLDKANYKKEESQDFYQIIWKLKDAEYALFPFI